MMARPHGIIPHGIMMARPHGTMMARLTQTSWDHDGKQDLPGSAASMQVFL